MRHRKDFVSGRRIAIEIASSTTVADGARAHGTEGYDIVEIGQYREEEGAVRRLDRTSIDVPWTVVSKSSFVGRLICCSSQDRPPIARPNAAWCQPGHLLTPRTLLGSKGAITDHSKSVRSNRVIQSGLITPISIGSVLICRSDDELSRHGLRVH
jgi:hypothetical protein